MRKNSYFFFKSQVVLFTDPFKYLLRGPYAVILTHSDTHHGEGLRRQRAIWLAGGYLWRSRRGWGLIATHRDLKTSYQVLKFSCSLNMWRDGRVDKFQNVQTRFWQLWLQVCSLLQLKDAHKVVKQKKNGRVRVSVPYWLCLRGEGSWLLHFSSKV